MTDAEAPERTGWWPDPTGRFEQRYAIRGGWTRRVRVGTAEAIDVTAVDLAHPGGSDTSWQQRADPDAGWRADPTGRFEQRWWDGAHWTRKVRHAEAVATDTTAAPSARSRRRRRDRSGDGPPPPGWLPDPDGAGERFWNGHAWTAKHRSGQVATVGTRAAARAGTWWSRRALVAAVGVVVVALAVLAALVVMLWPGG